MTTTTVIESKLLPDPSNPSLRIFTLSLGKTQVEICTLGASITRLLLPSSKKSQIDDCVLGYDNPQSMYTSKNPCYLGVIVGRVANRIRDAKFRLPHPCPTKIYKLESNDGNHHLHGGVTGFGRSIWDAQILNDGVQFSLTSQSGDEGYPGTVRVTATYSLICPADEETVVLRLCMRATLAGEQDKMEATPINLAQHSYFNLGGHDDRRGNLDHVLTILADGYTPTDSGLIPTREIRGFDQDPCMDFSNGKRVEDALAEYAVVKAGVTEEKVARHVKRNGELGTSDSGKPYGFDHNYVLRHPEHEGDLVTAAILRHPPSGRQMTVKTNAKGIQFYSGNFLDGTLKDGKGGAKYNQWQSICLETQNFPDSIMNDNNTDFAKGKCFILEPGGKDYEHNVEYHFSSISERKV